MAKSGRQKAQEAKLERKRKRRLAPQERASITVPIPEKKQSGNKHSGHKTTAEKNERTTQSHGGRHMGFILGFTQTIITAVLVAGAIGATYYFLTEKNAKGVIWSLFALWCLVGLSGALYALQHYVTVKPLAEEPAKLTPSATPSPTPPKLQHPAFREKSEQVSVDFGGMGFTFLKENLRAAPGIPMRIAGFVPVTLHVVGDNVFADAEVYGGQGKPTIKIVRNEFEVTPPGWDKNSSENAFEVVDEKQIPVFQMIYETPSRIVIKGYIILPNGRLLFADDKGLSFDLLPKKPLDRIFKYPAWKYPGVYNE
jgi:hypothetical protein